MVDLDPVGVRLAATSRDDDMLPVLVEVAPQLDVLDVVEAARSRVSARTVWHRESNEKGGMPARPSGLDELSDLLHAAATDGELHVGQAQGDAQRFTPET